MNNVNDVNAISGLTPLWNKTLGQKEIRIAVIDGPVDLSHPCMHGASIDYIDEFEESTPETGPASDHGTYVASLIFGQHGSAVKGIAPQCHGIIIPVFRDGPGNSLAPASEIDLARAISRALEAGAQIINISGGQLSDTGEAHPLLDKSVISAVHRNVLIVAAAGNDGCACIHVPGALPAVLAVGAVDAEEKPLGMSNWGEAYQDKGILALGDRVPGAKSGGGIVAYSGTSVSAPIVTGVAGLLLSLQLASGTSPNPLLVRQAILSSGHGCDYKKVADCRRLLKGRLNINGAISILMKGGATMENQKSPHDSIRPPDVGNTIPAAAPDGASPGVLAATADMNGGDSVGEAPQMSENDEELNEDGVGPSVMPSNLPQPASQHVVAVRQKRGTIAVDNRQDHRIYPSACTACDSAPQLVYALGTIYYDFGTDARRDSLGQAMGVALGAEGNADDPVAFITYLEGGKDPHPWDSASVIWTLNDESTPIYAIQPAGPFSSEVYTRLRQFLMEQLNEGVERVSIPGYIGGKVRLYIGMEVPVIYPDLRGMYSWSTQALVKSIVGAEPKESDTEKKKHEYRGKSEAIRSFLDRVYYDIRNMGLDPRDRAMNYAATNAFQLERVFERSIKEEMQLDTIEVERSPVCRVDSDCWDVKLYFFNPAKQFEIARKVYRFTVDVSDVVPVLVGEVRQWSVH